MQEPDGYPEGPSDTEWEALLPPNVRAALGPGARRGPNVYRTLFADPVRSARLTDRDYVALMVLDAQFFARTIGEACQALPYAVQRLSPGVQDAWRLAMLAHFEFSWRPDTWCRMLARPDLAPAIAAAQWADLLRGLPKPDAWRPIGQQLAANRAVPLTVLIEAWVAEAPRMTAESVAHWPPLIETVVARPEAEWQALPSDMREAFLTTLLTAPSGAVRVLAQTSVLIGASGAAPVGPTARPAAAVRPAPRPQ